MRYQSCRVCDQDPCKMSSDIVECRTCHMLRYKFQVAKSGICNACEPLVWSCYVCNKIMLKTVKYCEQCEVKPYWKCDKCHETLPISVPYCLFCNPKWKCYKCQRWELYSNQECTYCKYQQTWTCYSCRRQFTQVVKSCPCLLYTSPSPRDYATSRMPSSA